MYFQQGATVDINILMGAALTFIKEPYFCWCGRWHPEGWWMTEDAACAGVCQLLWSLHVSQRRPDVSLGPCSSSHRKHWFTGVVPLDFIATVSLVWSCGLVKVLLFLCLFIRVWVSSLPLFIQVFICLLQPAYRLLYNSWAPYCFLDDAGCMFSLLSHLQAPWQSFIYYLAGLNFRITVAFIIKLLQFHLILYIIRLSWGLWTKLELSQITMTASIFKFSLIYYMYYSSTPTPRIRKPFYRTLKTK